MTVSMRDMLEAGVHYGHQTKFWNPKMKPYIYGARNKIHIINLDKTMGLFKDALKFADQEIKNNGTILFVGTRSQASEIISGEAKRAGMPYVDHRWLGGMLTNFETVKNSIKKLESKKAALENATEDRLSKKEQLDLTREINKLESAIGGIVEMKKLPTALFVIDTGCHEIAIQEAKKLSIPVIGVVDSNNDPSDVDYVIPGNDDSAKAIRLYSQAFADVIVAAKKNSLQELAAQSKLEIVDENADKATKTVHKVKKATKATSTKEEAKSVESDTKVETEVAEKPVEAKDKETAPKKKATTKTVKKTTTTKANDSEEKTVKVTKKAAPKKTKVAEETKDDSAKETAAKKDAE